MKSAAMGVIPFKINDDLRTQLQAFGSGGGGDIDWIEMVRFVPPPFARLSLRPDVRWIEMCVRV